MKKVKKSKLHKSQLKGRRGLKHWEFQKRMFSLYPKPESRDGERKGDPLSFKKT